MLSILCPVCGSNLICNDKSYRCEGGHCFDIAKSGYVNILPPKGSGHHGDDKLMVKARTSFLDKGYYAPLCEAVSDYASKLCPSSGIIIDAGCGEGYYSARILHKCRENGSDPELLGIDISKYALMSLRKREPQITAVAASTAQIPVADSYSDVVINIFSPLFEREFRRVLKEGGYLIRAVPRERHLIELKELIYDSAYLNPSPEYNIEGFSLFDKKEIDFTMALHSNDDIMSLFMMTPYYYKTSEKCQQKAAEADSLMVTASFEVQVYKAV